MALLALVDCNNFYVSCERVFKPALNNKPVIVLSNNDGCAVARSDEAKALGIGMGVPVFKIKQLIEKEGVTVFSSNYALYGDMSRRVMETLSTFTPDLEIYSIDEAFLDFSGFPDPVTYGQKIRRTIGRHIGIPVSVGIGSTKTLAKMAARIAKKAPKTDGVLDLTSPNYLEKALSITPIGDIWGVGSRSARYFKARGILTAKDLRDAPEQVVRSKMGICGVRIQAELSGTPCYTLETAPSVQKAINASRSFRSGINTKAELTEAIATYATRAAEKLRSQNALAGMISVYIMTNRFEKDTYYYNSADCLLEIPGDDTSFFIRKATECLDHIFRPGLNYKKAGVMLTHLSHGQFRQTGLFESETRARRPELMSTLDQINRTFGQGTLNPATCGMPDKRAPWRTQFNHKSPAYTTRWDELARAS